MSADADDCACLECRIRALIIPDPAAPIPICATLGAIGPIVAELLAHLNQEQYLIFIGTIDRARDAYKRDPRVMVQQPAQGRG